MSHVIDEWRVAARSDPRRIVLCDRDDERAAAAADLLVRDGLAEPVLLGRDVADLGSVRDAAVEDTVARLAEDAAGRGRPLSFDDPLTVGAVLVRAGWADGAVAGASRPTADVIRAGIRILGLRDGVDVVSSSFLLILPSGEVIVYGDCGVLPDPDAEQLAAVAVSTAGTYAQLTGEEPRVAMLSFSTKGSAEHPRVEKVRAATELAMRLAPDLSIDGELQFDAAWVDTVAESKAPGSPVAGRANVFVFPDLDSGNIAYKITERLGGARAFGPLLQGLDGVLHDLSRGCSVDDIVDVAVIASRQAALAGQ